MDSRKYQLQKQIIEALEAKNNDLYSQLRSQWAHRFGVESLAELENLDLNQLSQNSTNENNQKIDPSLDYLSDTSQSISMKDDDSQSKEVTNEKKKINESVSFENKESFEKQSYEIWGFY